MVRESTSTSKVIKLTIDPLNEVSGDQMAGVMALLSRPRQRKHGLPIKKKFTNGTETRLLTVIVKLKNMLKCQI